MREIFCQVPGVIAQLFYEVFKLSKLWLLFCYLFAVFYCGL